MSEQEKNLGKYSSQSGVLSDVDIRKAIENLDILITPFDESKLTPLGYNLTPTRFIFSIKRRTIEKIRNEKGLEYVMIRPNDTVLVLSRESLFVSSKIMGTFHSKVGMVSKGFGHVSTTLDPFWEGPLLFAINNPTAKRIKLPIQKVIKDNNKIFHYSFITVIFQSLLSMSENEHDNPALRIKILKSHIKGKYFIYKQLQEFCTEIEALAKGPTFLFRDRYKTLYNKNNNNDVSKEKLKKEFDKKYSDYIRTVNETIDNIFKINKWIVLLNFFKKLLRNAHITLLLAAGSVVVLLGFLDISLLDLSNYQTISVGLAMITAGTALISFKSFR